MSENYLKAILENYFVKDLVVLGHAGNGEEPADMLGRNSYALPNVPYRFF